MDKGEYKKLHGYHVVFLVHQVMAGVGLLSLPHSLSPVKYSQWIVVIFSIVFLTLTIIPIIYLGRQFPRDNLFSINEKLLGKYLGKGVNILITLYLIGITATISREYLLVMQSTTLPERSLTIPLILLLFLMTYIVSGGIKSIARFCILAFFLTIWMIFLLEFPVKKGEFFHLIPIFNFSLGEFFDAFNRGYKSFIGCELILIYFPYIIDKRKVFKHVSMGLGLTLFSYSLVVISSTVFFTVWQLENIKFPVLNLLKAVEFSFMERVENFFISYWIILLMSTATTYLWAAKKGIDSIVSKNQAWFLGIPIIIIFFAIKGPLPQSIQRFIFESFVNYFGYGVLFLPIPLIIIHKLRSIRRKAL